MNETPGNSSFRNFIMLSRKMHILFLQYILGGRMRAPPEADLTYLIPTFQNGAKTDRRALQSKFKSWAKRMFVENYKLKLICSGKEIIPIEDSCKIVMGLHFQGHQPVSQIINQIQEKYSWTKKNFGLDREMIVDFILKNCSNQDCIRAIKSDEFVWNYQRNDLIKEVILSPGFSVQNIYNPKLQSSAQTANPSTLYRWSIKYPLSTNSQEKNTSFPNNLKITNVRSVKPACDNSTNRTHMKKTPENREIVLKEPTNKLMDLSGPNVNMPKASKSLTTSSRSFKKPKNINDFKALLKAAEQFTDFPAVLCNPKTKFLGSFGLVPKRICSMKTLSKVEKERKRKRVQDMQNMIYHKNRKNLRDRNKLNKIKLREIAKRAYLDNFKRNPAEGLSKVLSKSPSSPKSDNAINKSDDSNVICSADDTEVEIVEVFQKADEPEVIDIVSSDDENCFKDSSSKSDARNGKTILMNGDKKLIKMKETKTLSSLQTRKVGNFKINHQNSQAESTSSPQNSKTQNRYHPIFKKYLLPSKSNGEVAILPSSQWRSKVLLSQNKTIRSLNSKNLMPVKLSKSFMQGKKPILQPISKVVSPKSFSMQTLTTPGIANKIPLDTNVYLVQKQPSGVIKMVPCKRVIATDNSKGTSKEGPTSVTKSGSNVCSPTKTKYRNILPASDKVVEMKRLKVLNANKVSIDEEMTKLTKWIGGMKSTVARTYLQLHVQRSKQRLESQLNAAIALVKNIRRKLWEIEKLEDQVNGKASTDTNNDQEH